MRLATLLLTCTFLAPNAGCNAYRPTPSDTATDDFDLGPLPDFSLITSRGDPLTKRDLDGKFWIASFIFTRCTGECPQVSGTMARLQKELSGKDDVRLVSLSVDPEHDTPETLRFYAKLYGADARQWLFVTGDKRQVYDLIVDGFHLGVEQATGSNRKPGREVTHSSSLMLVDRQGHIRGKFEGQVVDPDGKPVDDVPRLLKRLEELRREQP
jgi:cytochrome oxidase Cu insertion factor (SCO1/SenC/PrrC family)